MVSCPGSRRTSMYGEVIVAFPEPAYYEPEVWIDPYAPVVYAEPVYYDPYAPVVYAEPVYHDPYVAVVYAEPYALWTEVWIG